MHEKSDLCRLLSLLYGVTGNLRPSRIEVLKTRRRPASFKVFACADSYKLTLATGDQRFARALAYVQLDGMARRKVD